MKKLIILFTIISLSLFGQDAEQIYRAKVPLTATQIRTAFSAPVQMIASPGAGKAIEVINADIEFIFGTASFNMIDGGCGLITNTAQSYQFFASQVLLNSVSAITRMTDQTGDISQLVYNQPVYFKSVFDASLGDGTANIYILYRIINANPPAPAILDTIVTLTSAQILSLFTTPVTLIPAPGSNKTIEVVSMTDKLIFNTTAYLGNRTLVAKTATATGNQAVGTVLNQIANCKHHMIVTAPIGLSQILSNQPLIATTLPGDPTTGDSSIQLHIFYRILDY